LLLVLIILCIGTTITAVATNPDNLTCGGKKMGKHDVCVHKDKYGNTEEKDFDEERQSQQTTRTLTTIAAIVLWPATIGYISFLVIAARKRKAAPTGYVYPGNYPQANMPYPPPGNYIQQPGNYPPPGNYPQANMPYPPPGNYIQQPGNYPPPPGNYLSPAIDNRSV
jgi:hypothetical protein